MEELNAFEREDPELFDELAMKRRWTFVSKDPSRAIKDSVSLKTSYWNLLNHLPKDKVKKIVTNQALKLDQESCKMILEKILKEQ